MRIKKHLRGFLGVFLAMVLTVGCAGQADGSGASGGIKDNSGASAGNTDNSQDGSSDTKIKGKQLYLGEYTRLLLKDSVSAWDYQNKELYADAYDGVVYILEEYRSGEGEDMSRQFFLTTYGSGATELSWEPFALDFLEKGKWFIRSMAVPEEGKLSFWVYEYGSKNAETAGGMDAASDFLAVTDLKGNLLSLTESIPEEEEYPWNRIGTLVVRGADGSMAISRKEQERNDQTVFYSYDPENGRREEIVVSVEVSHASAIYPEGNMLYYVDGANHLFRWDDREKKLTDMMNLTDINFPRDPSFTFILSGSAGRLLLCSLSTEMLQVFALSEEERHPEDEIRMSILRESSAEYKLETAAEYNYAHWNCPISTERPEKNEEDAFWNRIMAQIVAGKGPDLMLVTAEDMVILAEKGVLLDLAELTSEETMGQIFQCAVQDGTVDGKIAVLFVSLTGNWNGEAKEYLLFHLDGEGNIISRTELLASYQEQGMEYNDLAQGLWQCDEQGYSYVLANERKTLTIFDAGGDFVMSQDYSGKDDVTIETAFHAPDGSLIFSLSDAGQGATTLVWLDTGKKQWKELVSINTPYLKQFTMLENGQIYYSRGSNLIKWDVQTGRQERVFQGLPSGITDHVEHVSVTEQEELILYIVRRDRVDIRVLSDKQPETEGITLVDFAQVDPYVQSRVADYNRDSDNIRIQYKSGNGDEETLWPRTMAELAAGKGPDMLCLRANDEHLRTLYEKGVLADLTGLVPKETLDQIFPGVLEAGSVDGSLVGLGVSGWALTMITSNELWQQDSWTVEDIMRIVEAHPDLEGILIAKNKTMNPSYTLYQMGLQHLENSPFVDFGKKGSHFEDTQFPKFLELAKTYGEAPVPSEELSTLIKEGKCIATLTDLRDASDYVEAMEEYGEECHFIGCPGQTDHSGYWSNLYLIVVNKKSEYSDTIAGFLSYLLDAESQQKVYGFSVREDVVRQYIRWADWDERWYYVTYIMGSESTTSWTDFTKSNGECYIEDYVEFLRKLGPMTGYGSVISDIVLEEAEYYFNGTKSAGQAAEIIDNRVQLYLDE